jgi:hypothetical protein
MFDLGTLMAQAQNMLSQMEERKSRIDEELGSLTVVGSAGQGAVEIALSGNREVRRVVIKPDAIDSFKPDLLEDLVYAALADALRQANAAYESKMAELSDGLNVGGMDLSSIRHILR